MNNALTQMKMLEQVVSALSEDLIKDLVFIGGCTTSLFLDPENLSLSTRYTQDVDLIVDIKTTTQWYELDEKVRKLGFKNYQSSDPFEKNTDFTCRYQLGEDLIVDFMPTDEKILGFSNSWYLEAYKKKVEYKLGNNLIINTLMPEYFLATKFEAFHGRKEDPLYSKDLEDIITICLGRSALVEEVYNAPKELKDYLSDQFKKLTELTDFEIIMEDQCRFGSRERALQVIQAIIKQWPKSILINSFSLCQNLSAPEKFGIDAVGNLTDNENLYYCYVVDGHGGCKNSDILVKNFQAYVLSLKDVFAQLNNTTQDIHDFFERLTENFYIEHRGKLRPAAMSILMVIFSQTQIYSAHLGDCRLGKINNEQQISWITYPHNLAMSLNNQTDPQSIEMILRSSSNDNIVTKSFNTKKLKPLSFKTLDIEKKSTYILASDGFWKLSENDIKTIIYSKNLSEVSSLFDDISLWVISFI